MSNAERQRRYIERLKAGCRGIVSDDTDIVTNGIIVSNEMMSGPHAKVLARIHTELEQLIEGSQDQSPGVIAAEGFLRERLAELERVDEDDDE